MSALAPTLQAFFTDRLLRQRHASPHTIAAYRDALRLLLIFAAQHTGKQPSQFDLDDLDAPLIAAERSLGLRLRLIVPGEGRRRRGGGHADACGRRLLRLASCSFLSAPDTRSR